MSKCPECGGDVPPSLGTRPRKFCSDKCAMKVAHRRYHAKHGLSTKSLWMKKNPTQRSEARRRWRLKSKYGLSVSAYEEMEARQSGLCVICREPCVTGRKLAVDHNHETGAIRALLCQPCNTTLGHMRERPDLLRAAASYLETHQQPKEESCA